MNELTCLACKKKFKVKTTFCSRECSNSCRTAERLNLWLDKHQFRWKNATEEEKRQRLIQKYEKHVIRKEGCWAWKGAVMRFGYGQTNHNGIPIAGHRASWIIHKGRIPKDMCVLHKCDNPPCSNPDHLFLGTDKDNHLDMITKGRDKSAFGEQHVRAQLKEKDVIEIRKLLDNKISLKVIAEKYDITASSVWCIKKRKSWKHLI